MTNKQKYAEKLLGNNAAKRIAYRSYEEGKDFDKERNKEFTKQVAFGAAVVLTPAVIALGKSVYDRNISFVHLNNELVSEVAKLQGLRTVNGGFTTGASAIKAGMAYFEILKDLKI